MLAWSVGKKCVFNGVRCQVTQVGRGAQGGVDLWRVEVLSRRNHREMRNTKTSRFWAGLTGAQAEAERVSGRRGRTRTNAGKLMLESLLLGKKLGEWRFRTIFICTPASPGGVHGLRKVLP